MGERVHLCMADGVTPHIHIEIDARKHEPTVIRHVAEVLRGYPGNQHVCIDVDTSLGPKRILVGQTVDAFDPCLIDDIELALGE